MKVTMKGKFEIGLTEVPEKLAKELEEKLEKINSTFANLEVKVEEE